MRKWLASLALVAVGIASVPVAAQQQQRVPLPQPQPQQQQQQTQQQAQQRPPNILVIMGDDVGWFNIAPTIAESCRARRRTSTGWHPKA